MRRLLFLSVAVCLLSACGGTPESNNPEIGMGQYSVIMFSTPNCEACETVLPRTDQLVNTQLTSVQRAHVDIKGYVITAADGFHPPTAAIADAYKAKLGLTFPVFPDPWRWTNYKKYYGAEELRVPGAVVIDPTGTWTKFDSGFTAEKVFAYLQSIMP